MLTSLNGLANLTSVEGLLDVSLNSSLTNVDGLANLTYVGGSLAISVNDALTSLEGLYGLTYVGDWLSITGNYNLPDCEACKFIRQIDYISGRAGYYQNLADDCSEECPENW
jgi:hypothetical protein